MILIGDAGGTRTEWRVIDNGQIQQLETRGFNVVHDTIEEYIAEISIHFEHQSYQAVHLYLAGYLNHDTRLFSSLEEFFKGANVHIESDLLAVGRGLCHGSAGWIGILGTGANFARYDGEHISSNVPPLGFILGDEGSGSFIGKKLLADYLRDRMPEKLKNTFNAKFNDLNQDRILQTVYQSDNSKKFLASFCPFIGANIADPYCYELVYNAFLTHFAEMTKELEIDGSLNYSGSIAFNFAEILRRAAGDVGLKIDKIVASPIAGLSIYHEENN